MARNVKQSSKVCNSTGTDQTIYLGSFNLSKARHWGTTLEKKLTPLPYPELRQAFAVVADAVEYRMGKGAVQEIVKATRPEGIESKELTDSSLEDHPFSKWHSEQAFEDVGNGHDYALGPAMAFIVLDRLWVLSELLGPSAREISTAEVVSAITQVCLYAEKARHVCYTEERTCQLTKVIRPRKSCVSAKTKNAERGGVDPVEGVLRWLKKNGRRFTSRTDAAMAYLESNLNPIRPIALYWLLQQAHVVKDSAPVTRTHRARRPNRTLGGIASRNGEA